MLYSRTVRDWLGLLYTDEVIEPPFQVFWSEDVLGEAIYQLRRKHPLWDGAKITLVRDRIAKTFETGRVDDFTVDGSYPGSDPHDAHVHAACVACRADYLLTENVRDFPSGVAHQLSYEVLTPDEFFQLVDDDCPQLVDHAVTKQIDYWGRRTEDVDLVGSLKRANCPGFADRVLEHLRQQALRR